MEKQPGKKILLVTEAIVVLFILALVNFLGTRFFTRWDLTRERMYKLAPASKEAVSKLPDVLNLSAFISSKVPSEMTGLVSGVKDLLSEYDAYGNANFRVKFYDPTTDQKAAEKAKNLGIEEFQVQVFQKGSFSAQRAWLGIAFEYGDKKASIPSIGAVENLEYEITSNIAKVTTDGLPKVGVLEIRGPQMQGQDQNRFNNLKNLLRDDFDVVNVNFDAEEKIPDDINVLFISDTWGITDFGKYLIDQYLLRGGHIVWLAEGITIGQGLQAYPSLPGIDDMMKTYGLTLERKLLLDTSCEQTPVPTGQGWQVVLDYYPWLRIAPANLDKKFPVTAKLEGLSLFWASPMKAEVPKDAGFTAEPVLETSGNAWIMESPYNLDPLQDWKSAPRKDEGQYTVGVYSKGIFKSFYAGKETPMPIKKPSTPGEDPGLGEPTPDVPEKLEVGVKDGGILAIGNAKFASDQFLTNLNQIFLLNAADYFGYGDKLIGIRSRGKTTAPLNPRLSSVQKNAAYFLNLLAMPILIILYGISRLLLRKANRNAIRLKYAGASRGGSN